MNLRAFALFSLMGLTACQSAPQPAVKNSEPVATRNSSTSSYNTKPGEYNWRKSGTHWTFDDLPTDRDKRIERVTWTHSLDDNWQPLAFKTNAAGSVKIPQPPVEHEVVIRIAYISDSGKQQEFRFLLRRTNHGTEMHHMYRQNDGSWSASG